VAVGVIPLASSLSADEYHHRHHYNYVRHVHVVTVPLCMPNDNPGARPTVCNPPAPIAYVSQHHHTRYLAPETRYVFAPPHRHPGPKIRDVVEKVNYHHHYAGHHHRMASHGDDD